MAEPRYKCELVTGVDVKGVGHSFELELFESGQKLATLKALLPDGDYPWSKIEFIYE